MPVWVPELNMLYVLVPRTGSTAFRRHLILEYGGVDLRSIEAVEAGLVSQDHGLRKHSNFEQVQEVFRAPVRRRKITRVAGVRNPADSLFSSWWKHTFVYPGQIEQLDDLPEADQRFLNLESTRRRIERISQKTFSEWILAIQLPTTNLWYESADAYLRFEEMNADWQGTCRRRRWPYRGEVPTFNETQGRPPDYSQYLNASAAARLRDVYARQLARFGYQIKAGAAE